MSKGYVTGCQGNNIQVSANISPSGSAICNMNSEIVGIAKIIEVSKITLNIGKLISDPTNVLYFGLSLKGIKSFLRNLGF